MTMIDDMALVTAWRDGDREAGAQLFDRYYASIARFFRNKVGPQSADLVQSTFLQCFEGLGRMHSSNFRSYLFAIACNLLRKHYLLDEDNRTYGFYLWRSREAAERAHGSEFRQRVRERFGCEPSISYYDALLVLDNLNGEVSEDLGGPVSAP